MGISFYITKGQIFATLKKILLYFYTDMCLGFHIKKTVALALGENTMVLRAGLSKFQKGSV